MVDLRCHSLAVRVLYSDIPSRDEPRHGARAARLAHLLGAGRLARRCPSHYSVFDVQLVRLADDDYHRTLRVHRPYRPTIHLDDDDPCLFCRHRSDGHGNEDWNEGDKDFYCHETACLPDDSDGRQRIVDGGTKHFGDDEPAMQDIEDFEGQHGNPYVAKTYD